MAEAKAGANAIARTFDYPPNATKKRKKDLKERTLVRNPDVLFQDTRRDGSECNLIFFTSFKEDWRQTILEAFPNSEIVILEDKENINLSEMSGTVSMYPSGKFVIQGNIENLTAFAGRFEKLKEAWDNRVINRRLQNLGLDKDEPKDDEE